MGGPATRPCDDRERAGSAIGAHDQRLEDAARAHGRQYIGHVRRLLRVAHVGFADRQLVLKDKVEFHDTAPCACRSRRSLDSETGPVFGCGGDAPRAIRRLPLGGGSDGHTCELQTLLRISYAIFCLKKNTYTIHISAPTTN